MYFVWLEIQIFTKVLVFLQIDQCRESNILLYYLLLLAFLFYMLQRFCLLLSYVVCSEIVSQCVCAVKSSSPIFFLFLNFVFSSSCRLFVYLGFVIFIFFSVRSC